MNRAKEFIIEALGLMKYGKYAQAETVVFHALREVAELEQLARVVSEEHARPVVAVFPPRRALLRDLRDNRRALEG